MVIEDEQTAVIEIQVITVRSTVTAIGCLNVAVSSDDGTYEITGVPAGTYTLVAWHELYGRREIPLTIADGAVVDGNVTYGK